MVEVDHKTRDIPIWLTTLAVLLCLGGGTYLIVWFLNDKQSDPVVITGDKAAEKLKGAAMRMPGMGFGGGRTGGGQWNGGGNNTRGQIPAPVTRDGVQELRRGGTGSAYRARAGNAQMEVNIDSKNREEVDLKYGTLLSAEQAEYLMIRYRLVQDSSMQTFLKLTEEQIQKLKNVPPPEGMKASADEKAQLLELFRKWKSTPDKPSSEKAAAEKSLVTALDDIGKKRLDDTRAYAISRVDAVKSALTADQFKLLKDGARPPAPPPAAPAITPRPAPAPAPTSPVSTPAPAATTPEKTVVSPASSAPKPADPAPVIVPAPAVVPAAPAVVPAAPAVVPAAPANSVPVTPAPAPLPK